MRRVRLRFAGIGVEFVDRDAALKRVEEWAGRGTYPVQVVYGPEGCGKTAWLKQSVALLGELGFEVLYINPLHKEYLAHTSVGEIVKILADTVADATGRAELRLAALAVDLVKHVLRIGRRRVAVLVDDAFQAIGLDKAAVYVKSLLGLIEYPPSEYERIVVIVATSEGISRREIGRHRWAELRPMWNMSKDGFLHLYEQVPGGKPPFEEVWRVTGGNPGVFARIYRAEWQVDNVVDSLVKDKDITVKFVTRWRQWLEEAVEDPDALWSPDVPEELVNELIEKNLIVYNLHARNPWFWIDNPPPEKDLELGIGRYVAWQTPLHREAVRKALKLPGRAREGVL